MIPTENETKTPPAATGLFALLSNLFRVLGTGAPNISHGSGAPKASRRLILSVLTTMMTLCALAGSLAFSPAPAQAASTRSVIGHFGPGGPGVGVFSEPQSITVEQGTGDVFVYDVGEGGRVYKFNAAGEPEDFSSSSTNVIEGVGGGAGESQIAVDSSSGPDKGDIYVDTGQKVLIYSSTGAKLATLIEEEEPCGVAVDQSGDVYVAFYAEDAIKKYTPVVGTNPVTSADYTSSLTGLVEPCDIAVGSTDEIYVAGFEGGVTKYEASQFDAIGTAMGTVIDSMGTTVAADPAGEVVYIDEKSDIAEYTLSGKLEESFGALSESAGVAESDTSGDVYAAEGNGSEAVIFGPAPAPPVVTGEATNLQTEEGSATLNGTVNPEGVEVTSCEFEYGTEADVYPQKEPCSQTLPLTGAEPVAVSANLSELTPGTRYHYRLVVGNVSGENPGRDRTFVAPRRPAIGGQSALEVDSTRAKLIAEINPGSLDTTYHFEYDTSEYNTGASHGTSLPVPNADIGSGTSPVSVDVELQNLQPGTSYHYRVVTTNALKTVDGPDGTLTTPTLPGEAHGEGCTNEQLRIEQPYGLTLPDCRAYEMVSPLDKNDTDAVEEGEDSVVRASLSGEAITYNSYGSFAEPVGTQYVSQYLSSRGPASWSTRNITPPYEAYQTISVGAYRSLTFTPELSEGITETDVPLTSEALPEFQNLYVADFAGASYQLVSSNEQASAHAYEIPEVVGASSDLSHVLFEDRGTIYEWADGRLSVVNVAPNGGQMGARAGGGSEYEAEGTSFWRAMSDNGARVFMTSPGSFDESNRQLYVRENPEQEQSPLSGEECTVPSDACTVEVSASQKTNGSGPGGTDPNGPQSVRYWGASVDGSRVFFTSCEKLTNDATAASPTTATEDPCKPGASGVGNDLYEYNLESKHLTDLTVDPKDTDGAAVLGVVDISEDGSYVYFVAEGELAAGAVAGQPNLYLDHDGVVTFIATLEPEGKAYDQNPGDSSDWSEVPGLNTVRETPDGTHLAFLSSMSLTGYDNEQAATGECEDESSGEDGKCREVYEYDAGASGGSLICVSCDPSGARPVGPSSFADENGRAPEGEAYTSRNFSEDGGRLFFQSRDALVPQDGNGLQDVYEYEDGHVYPISDVAGGYESSFLDASASGDDVFIATTDQLLPRDTDFRTDVYDARVGGGFPISASSPACDNADACKAPVSPQPAVFGTPASATFSGAGNLAPVVPVKPAVKPKAKAKPKQCKKGLVRQHGKCVKKKAKKKTSKSSRRSKKGRK